MSLIIGTMILLASASTAKVTFVASPPSRIVATTAPGQYVYFPQTLQRVGNQSLLCSIQSDADGIHPNGWTGRQFASADDGATWSEVSQPAGFPWLVKPCLATGDGLGVTCLSYPLQVMLEDKRTASIQRARFTLASGSSLLLESALPDSIVTFPEGREPMVWSNSSIFRMVTDGNIMSTAGEDGSSSSLLIMNIYGNYAVDGGDDEVASSIVTVQSDDEGARWRWRSDVARPDPTKATPCYMPSESHMARLANRSLLTVWRSVGADSPLCSSVSNDEGLSWSAPRPLSSGGVHGVEP